MDESVESEITSLLLLTLFFLLVPCANAVVIMCKREPNELPIRVAKIKPFVEPRGGSLSARWGGARRSDNASHEPAP